MVQTVGWTTAYQVPDSLLSDTEESVVGTEWHQEAIGALAEALRAVAWARGLSWGICEQVGLTGLLHRDGSPYDPRPDVMVLPQPLASGSLSEVAVAEGVPLFIAEVASRSTRKNDIGEKQRAYAAIGVGAYLVFDPDGQLLPQRLQGWLWQEGDHRPWRPGADGWWACPGLDLSFQPDPPYVAVRDRDGTLVERSLLVRARAEAERIRAEAERIRAEAEGARAALLDQRYQAERARVAEQEQRIAALEAELRRLRGR